LGEVTPKPQTGCWLCRLYGFFDTLVMSLKVSGIAAFGGDPCEVVPETKNWLLALPAYRFSFSLTFESKLSTFGKKKPGFFTETGFWFWGGRWDCIFSFSIYLNINHIIRKNLAQKGHFWRRLIL